MAMFDDVFDPNRKLGGCSCGGHASQDEHDREAAAAQRSATAEDEDLRYASTVDQAVLRALFPEDATRRNFLKAVGASTALAAVSQFFPLATAREAFAANKIGPLEKKDVKIGFIPITCATPIIMAHPMGFYSRYGLNAEVIKTAGWAVIRDKALNG
ncbi:MAG: ABC transporter substrate-binding protein, partial [Magnetospirillum sp.]